MKSSHFNKEELGALKHGHGTTLGSCGHTISSCRCHYNSLLRCTLNHPCARCLAEATVSAMCPSFSSPLFHSTIADLSTRNDTLTRVKSLFPGLSLRELEAKLFGNSILPSHSTIKDNSNLKDLSEDDDDFNNLNQKTAVFTSNGSDSKSLAGFNLGDYVKVRLHPKDKFPSPGWKIIKFTENTVIVQKSASLGKEYNTRIIGQPEEGGVGGTLIIPIKLFIDFIIHDKPLSKNR